MPLDFQILSFLKIFVRDVSGTMKARKLKVSLNMNNDWMYRVYPNRGQGSITLGVISLGRFSKKLKCILLDNFYVLSYLDETYVTLGGFKKVVHAWTVG